MRFFAVLQFWFCTFFLVCWNPSAAVVVYCHHVLLISYELWQYMWPILLMNEWRWCFYNGFGCTVGWGVGGCFNIGRFWEQRTNGKSKCRGKHSCCKCCKESWYSSCKIQIDLFSLISSYQGKSLCLVYLQVLILKRFVELFWFLGVPRYIYISVHQYNLPTFALNNGYFSGKKKAEAEVLSLYPNSGEHTLFLLHISELVCVTFLHSIIDIFWSGLFL